MKKQYVIMSDIENKEAYFKELTSSTEENAFIMLLTSVMDNAKIFDSIDEAQKIYNSIRGTHMKIYPVCPKCGSAYRDYPAISREDNKTEICSACGQKEAIDMFTKYGN